MDYLEFSAISGIEGTANHCRFCTLILGIAPRHSDTADVQFMVNGKPVIVALPMPGFADYRECHGRVITDAESIQIAGRILKDLIEQEVLPEDRNVTPSRKQMLRIAENLTGALAVEQPGVVPKLVTT